MAKDKEKRKKITIPDLYELRDRKEPITWLTAYDYPTAYLEDQAGIEMILVGDSVGMTVYGYEGTLQMTMDIMIEHTKAVRRAIKYAFLVGDMPYMSYQVTPQQAIENAGRFMREAGTDAVKLEGGERVANTIRAIVSAGIPVIGHIGLTPQSSALLGGFRIQGKDAQTAKSLIDDAIALERAGVFAILLECVPNKVAKLIKEHVSVLVFGIGAGDACDGQLLIVHDILGLFQFFKPKFVKRYANLSETMLEAFKSYRQDVKEKKFPQPEHFYLIDDEEYEKLLDLIADKKKV